ncbi:FitA-like ribbon-helix-helix domain-containing protein [Ramlibacter albus]|uniref:Arc family DNA-binding protein n=1 Tax=Ramlibacter albus TaxID=2079448 RepID=A0A923M521_9BURK|nr:Arc family DNA-binding protein [Ramlibacter albus]MBC5763981.1 Arc family DNA-binding protein [Ramlibacter albus]
MPNLSIKDVPEPLAEALRQRAARNHRSLQGELMAIIESAAAEPQGRPETPIPARNLRYPPLRRGWKTTEQIVAEQDAEGIEFSPDAPTGTDIIRKERDSR